jgi:hypothetical protein
MAQAVLEDLILSPDCDVVQVEAALRQHGAAVLPGWADAATLEALGAEFREVLDDRDESYAYPIAYAPGRAVSLMRAKVPAGRYPTLTAFFEHPKMRDLADRYVGHPCLLNYEVYATHETKPAVDVAPAHFDKLWTLKFMLYLNDIGPGNAPFGVAPGSFRVARQRFREIFEAHDLRRLAMSDDRYQAMRNGDLPDEYGPVVDIVGPRGTLIIFDTDTFHHAGTVEPDHERMILRGHSGPSVTYTGVRKGSRQWWRGEKRFSRMDMWLDQLAERF